MRGAGGPGARRQGALSRRSATTPPGRRSARSACRSGRAGRACRSIQPMYNLVKRQAEVEILPMAAANTARASCLTARPPRACSRGNTWRSRAGRLVTNKMYEARYGEPWMHEVAAKFVAFCRSRGLHPVSTAVAWVASHPAVTAPIIGARSLGAAPGIARLGEDRDDPGAARRDRGAFAHAAAGHRPERRAEKVTR